MLCQASRSGTACRAPTAEKAKRAMPCGCPSIAIVLCCYVGTGRNACATVLHSMKASLPLPTRVALVLSLILLISTSPAAQVIPPTYATMKKVQTTIPMKDGVRLAVNLYMPEGAKANDKFPVILEYLPYRKDDWSLARDWNMHSYFVRRGYITARVDIRGTGASEGNPPDREYSEQEQQDGLEVIDWLSRQAWSNGNVA